MAKINQIQAQEIINKFVAGRGTTELAAEYGIWTTSLGNILRGETWKQCERPANIRQLLRSQQSLRSGKKYMELASFSPLQLDILVGSLLGDGSLSPIKKRWNSRFAKTQILNRKPYLDWHLEQFQRFGQVRPVISNEKLVWIEGRLQRIPSDPRLSAHTLETHRHPQFTALREKWYPDGIKIVPVDLSLNPQRLAIWYLDDGSNCAKHRFAVICTNCFTVNEVEFLSTKLNELGLYPKIGFQRSKVSGNRQPILKFTKDSYDRLLDVVRPYVLWDCFTYKVEWRRAIEQWEYSSKFTPEIIDEIRELRTTMPAKEIAKQFNVHVNTIYAIVSNRSWKTVSNV